MSPPLSPDIASRFREPGADWRRLGALPRRGWDLVDVEDTEYLDFECRACGTMLRYVHHLAHPGVGVDDSPQLDCPYHIGCLRVGCVCAVHLGIAYTRAREWEHRVRLRAARLERLLNPDRWRPTRNGGLRRNIRGHRLVLYPVRFGSPGWRINVGNILGRKTHPTEEAAIRAAFDYMETTER